MRPQFQVSSFQFQVGELVAPTGGTQNAARGARSSTTESQKTLALSPGRGGKLLAPTGVASESNQIQRWDVVRVLSLRVNNFLHLFQRRPEFGCRLPQLREHNPWLKPVRLARQVTGRWHLSPSPGGEGWGEGEQSLATKVASKRLQRRKISGLNAFTLLELLMVVTIIGILAAVALPAIRGMTKSNAMAAADRQLLDDLGYARLRAMSDHTTVFVVFVPPNITDLGTFPLAFPANSPANVVISNLYSRLYTTYALISLRSVGDQPGRTTPHYLTDWRTLPGGVYIATNKFWQTTASTVNFAPPFAGVNSNFVQFPFPVATNPPPVRNKSYVLPYIAYNYQGQLVQRVGGNTGQDVPVVQFGANQFEYIPLARGSIFYTRNPDGTVDVSQGPDIQESPVGNAYYTSFTNAYTGQPMTGSDAGKIYNQIHIDPLTGRPHAETLQLQ